MEMSLPEKVELGSRHFHAIETDQSNLYISGGSTATLEASETILSIPNQFFQGSFLRFSLFFQNLRIFGGFQN